jgi:hypothetical protein
MREGSSRAQARRRVESNITIAMVCDLSAALQEESRRCYVPSAEAIRAMLLGENQSHC